MNKTYRSVWNESAGSWVAAPETAKISTGSGQTARDASVTMVTRGGRARSLKVALLPLTIALGGVLPGVAMASGICVTNTGGSKALDSNSGLTDTCGASPGWWDGETVQGQNGTQIYAMNTQIDLNGGTGTIFLAPTKTSGLWMTASGTSVLLDGVAAGAVNGTSVQGVNGSQLYNLASSNAAAIGGGSTVTASGTISNPSYALNETLSLHRAQAVRQALEAQGVTAARFEVNGRGAADPVKSCEGKKATAAVIACLAPNRRVEISAK